MIYVSYEFYFINLLLTLIILHHFHMCPSPFFSMFSLGKAWPWRVGAFSQHCMISTWIGELLDLNLAEEWLFRSARWHFDNVFLLGLGTFSEQNYPQLTHTFHLAFWEHLAQNHTMFSKGTVDLCQWWWLGTQLENDSELLRWLSKLIM